MKQYSPKQLLPLAQRTGRWVVKTIKGQATLYTTNLSSTIRFNITGALSFDLQTVNNGHPGFPHQVYAWRYDQQPWQRFQVQDSPVSLQLPDRHRHLVEIMTAGNSDFDEVWTGQEGFAINGIAVNGGQLTPAAERPLVDFIGDSITAGCWVMGQHAAVDYRPESNYVGIASDQLAIDSVRIAYSAAGVLRPGTGGVPTVKDFLGSIDNVTPWKTNQPRVVVVNLGVNDRRFASDQFTRAYDQFLEQVATTFPGSKVLVLTPFSQTFQSQISQLAARHQFQLVNTTGWCQDFTDGLHPNQNGSSTAAHHLVPVLKAALAESRRVHP